MRATSTFLITGASGNLGFAVLRAVLARPGTAAVVLARPGSGRMVEWLVETRLGAGASARVRAIDGDVCRPACGQEPGRLDLDDVTDVVHCAAEVRWDAPAGLLFDTNVRGTAHLLDLAERLHRRRSLRAVTVVSSAYVSGRREGLIPEALFPAPGFNNRYEESKFLLEREALRRASLPLTVVRPSSLAGDSRDGSIENFTTLYYPFRQVLERRLRFCPGARGAVLDFVPTDHAARVILAVHQRGGGERLPIVHACAGEGAIALDTLWQLACDVFDRLDPGPVPRRPGRIVPPWLARTLAAWRFVAPRRTRDRMAKLMLFVPYLSMRRRFAVDNARALGVAPAPSLEDYAEALCRFARQHRFTSSRRRFQVSVAPVGEERRVA